MKVGDLVQRKMIPGRDFYQIMKMFRNDFGGLRCEILSLTNGTRNVYRPSELKVLKCK